MANRRNDEAGRHLHLLFSGKSSVGQGDVTLLHRFVSARDEDAFAMLVARHGPMVWAVCRDVLRDRSDVEDAFQTTFLTLVRRAHSLWVDESLGGWLYRVAYHTALKINQRATRRNSREQADGDLSSVPDQETERRETAELHEAISRLPERYRRPLVLCELEGMPQSEAAQLLRCGEATLRRRLAGARERLKNQLTGQGVTPMAFIRIPASTQGILPEGLVATTLRAALGVRPGATMFVRIAGVSLMAGLVSAVGATYALSRPEKPKPTEPKVVKAGGEDRPGNGEAAAGKPPQTTLVRWVHLKSDQGYETWANGDAGIELTRKGTKVTMIDAANRLRSTYDGDGTIETDKPDWLKGEKDETGRLELEAMRGLVLSPRQHVPVHVPALLRPPSPFLVTDYDFDTLNGKKMIRADEYGRDALGKSRLEKQVWYDAETRRRVRSKYLYQLGEQQRYGKEFETIDYDYPETGPADMTALGVPREAKVVDLEKTRSHKWVDQAPEVQRAIRAQAAAFHKFPRNLRVVSKDDRGTIHLQYVSLDEKFVDGICKEMTSDARFPWSYDENRNFEADNQRFDERPDDLFPRLADAPNGDFDGERVVKWFPIDRALNTSLNDGQMTYNLTGSIENDQPRVHVLDCSYVSFADFLYDQWPVVRLRWQGLHFIPPAADTPPGMVVIKANSTLGNGDKDEPYPHYYTLDPAHEWIAVRLVKWRKEYEKPTWTMEETVARAFQHLADGSLYVSLWARSVTRGLEFEKPTARKPDRVGFIRTQVKVLRPEDFPENIFNGPKFLEKIKKAGGKIEPN